MSDPPFTQRASWIWSAEATHAAPAPDAATPSHYQVRLFRRTFEVADAKTARLEVHVSGDSRYLFFCNGELVGRGPAKGDVNHHFYESLDLTPRLRPGRNVLAALVLDMSRVAHRPTQLGAPCSVMTYAGGFVLDGVVWGAGEGGAGAAAEDVSTDASWKVAVDTAHRFQNEATTFEGYQGYFEHRVSRLIPSGWTAVEFDDARWPAATVLYKAELLVNRRDPTSPYGLVPRMIPALEERALGAPFKAVFLPGGRDAPVDWSKLVEGGTALTVPPHTSVELIVDVGELTTGFPQVVTTGGAGSTVLLTYAEALRLPWGTPGAKLLGRQQPLANLASHFADESTGWTFDRRGKISGWRDRWEPAGNAGATPAGTGEIFEPLHWRAFRYIGIAVTTGDEPLEIRALGYRFTAYPYHVAAEFACSDVRLERIWRAALRTMRLCSHETFEDCPYYEQMQYAGDTMITSKLAMLTTGDCRLTKQALYHFDWSRLSDGLTQSRFPSRLVQIIPSWSLDHVRARLRGVFGGCRGAAGPAAGISGGAGLVSAARRGGRTAGEAAVLEYYRLVSVVAARGGAGLGDRADVHHRGAVHRGLGRDGGAVPADRTGTGSGGVGGGGGRVAGEFARALLVGGGRPVFRPAGRAGDQPIRERVGGGVRSGGRAGAGDPVEAFSARRKIGAGIFFLVAHGVPRAGGLRRLRPDAGVSRALARIGRGGARYVCRRKQLLAVAVPCVERTSGDRVFDAGARGDADGAGVWGDRGRAAAVRPDARERESLHAARAGHGGMAARRRTVFPRD